MAQPDLSDSPSAPDERRSIAGGLLRTVRVPQWPKNLLVFAAPGAASVLDAPGHLTEALVAFASFCLAAGGTYTLNDALDAESDRRHPTKRHRPVAAGDVPLSVAWPAGFLLIGAGIALGLVADWRLSVTVVAYVALTTTYSLWLKHLVVIDIVAVAAGFVLRALGGAAATGVPISDWFFIVVSFGSLFVVTGKRQGEAGELREAAADIRPTLGQYSESYLAYLRSVSTGVVLVAYCLWAFEKAAQAGGPTPWFQLSIVPFVVAVLRYALLLDRGEGAAPEEIFLTDRALQAAGLVWVGVFGVGIWIT